MCVSYNGTLQWQWQRWQRQWQRNILNNRSQWWDYPNNIFFKWNDNDNKIFWAITHSDGTILELDISFHSCFSRLCVSCLPSCIQYKCPTKIQFTTDGLPSCIWYKCHGTPPGLKSAPSFCSPSSSFYPLSSHHALHILIFTTWYPSIWWWGWKWQ